MKSNYEPRQPSDYRHRSNLLPDLEFAYDDRPYNTLEAMLQIENSGLNSVADTTASANACVLEKRIMVALGLIAALLFFSGLQLYRSVNVKPIRVKKITPNKAFISKADSTAEIYTGELDRFADSHTIQTISIQNAISHGKF